MERYQHWFKVSDETFGVLSRTTCNATLKAFENAYESASNQAIINLAVGSSDPVYALCQAQASCILSAATQWDQQNLATSTLVLGLMPTILAIIAPSMTELALLAAHRPLLSGLLSLGTPAVLQGRVFTYEDPAEVLKVEHPRQDLRNPLVIGPWSRKVSTILGLAGYLLVAGAIINTLFLVIKTAQSSVLSWGCTRTWPLFVWMFTPIVIHALASWAFQLTIEKRRASRTAMRSLEYDDGRPVLTQPLSTDKTASHESEVAVASIATARSTDQSSTIKRFRKRLETEITSCTSHEHVPHPRRARVANDTKTNLGVILNTLAGFLGFLHLIFGTVSFSGLLFISPLDAIGQVALRLLLSAVICRCIVVLELGGLRGVSGEEEKEQ